MFKLVLEKAEEPEIRLPTSTGSSKKQESSRKTSISAFIDYAKAFDCVDHNKMWKILQEMGILDHLSCFLRNLYASQEATVWTGHGRTDWFQIGKEVHSPFSFLILLIWFFSPCFLISLANGLSILFIVSKNQLLALLIFDMVSLVSFAFISALIF